MSDLWLRALGKACSAYESGIYVRGSHWMRGSFYVLWKLEKYYSEAGNCKNCKEGPMIKAERYCPQMGSVPPSAVPRWQKTSLLNEHFVDGDGLDAPQIQKPDLSWEFSSGLQKYWSSHLSLKMSSEQRKHGIIPSTLK